MDGLQIDKKMGLSFYLGQIELEGKFKTLVWILIPLKGCNVQVKLPVIKDHQIPKIHQNVCQAPCIIGHKATRLRSSTSQENDPSVPQSCKPIYNFKDLLS